MTARTIFPGRAQGFVLTMGEEISFWGGVDPTSGVVIEAGHPRYGESVGGRVVVMPGGRGSSSSSSVLAELLRIGKGPAGILLAESDPILVVGAAVADVMYGSNCPIVVTPTEFADGDLVTIDATSDQALLEIAIDKADKHL